MAFNNFPYGDFQDLNLDWLLKKITEIGSIGDVAKSAVDMANKALRQASTAVASANSAKFTANEAKQTAENAQTTANSAQQSISEIRQVPSGGTTGDFLRKTADGYAWQTVPSAEGVSF